MRIAQIAQRAVDLDRAVTFYEDLLGSGVAARFDPPGLAFFTVDGVRLLLDRAAPSALVYLAVAKGLLEGNRTSRSVVASNPSVWAPWAPSTERL